MPKDSHIIVRVEPDLRARLERIALLERRQLSDLARLVFEDYIAHKETVLGLTLRDTSVHYGIKSDRKTPTTKPRSDKKVAKAADDAAAAALGDVTTARQPQAGEQVSKPPPKKANRRRSAKPST